MSKLSDAVALVSAARQSAEWDTSGECIAVRTTVFEKDGSVAGVLERNFNADQPAADVSVDLSGNTATAEGATL